MERFELKLTEELRKELDRAAAGSGLAVAQFIRMVLINYLANSAADKAIHDSPTININAASSGARRGKR